MTDYFQTITYGIVIVGCGILSGVFLAFSDFVMGSFSKIASPNGVEVIQVINREVFRPLFFILIIGMIPLCFFLAEHALITEQTDARWIVAGSSLYLIGGFGVTMVFNVPMNNELARYNPQSPAAADYWAHYLKRWTFWNHVRTAACAGAALCYLIVISVIS